MYILAVNINYFRKDRAVNLKPFYIETVRQKVAPRNITRHTIEIYTCTTVLQYCLKYCKDMFLEKLRRNKLTTYKVK